MATEEGTKRPNLKLNFFYNLLTQVLAIVIPFITTPYLARVLLPAGNGQISYASSLIAYFTLFANLGFNIYGQREIAKYQDDRAARSRIFWEIFLIRLVFTLAALSVLYAVIFTVGFGEKYNDLMLIFSVQVWAVIVDVQFLYAGEENFRATALRTTFVRLVGLALIFLCVKTADDVWIYACTLSATTLLSNLMLWPTISRHVGKMGKFEWRSLLRHVRPAVVVFFPVMVTSIFTTFDKSMIGWLAADPDYANGCYDQAYKINSMVQIVTTIFSSVMLSRNAYDYKRGELGEVERHVYQSVRYVAMTSLFFIAGFLVLSSNFSAWFLGEEYREVPKLLCVMSIRLLVSGFSVVLGDRFIVIGKEIFWTLSVLAGAIVNVVVNLLLIPGYGAMGAAVATAITEVMIFVVMACLSFGKGKLDGRKFLTLTWKYWLAALVDFGAMAGLQYLLGYSIWEFVLIGLSGAAVYALMLFALRDAFFLELVRKVFAKAKSVLKREKKEE